MIEHFPNKKEEFIKNESYKLLPLDKNSTYSILNLLAEEIPNEISQINFNDVSLDLFGPQILRIFSILVKNVDYINNPKVFDFLLNKYDDFVSNDLGNNLIRVLFGLLCNELYGKKSQIVDLLIKSLTIEKIIKQYAKVICYINNINDCGTSEDITNSNHYSSICDTIDDGILHFLYDNKFYHEFLSILIRKSSPSFIFIKELIQLMSILKEEEETIVFELCGIAEIYANKFEEDLIWLSNVNCLPILLLLYDKIGNTIYTSQSMIFFLSKVIQEKNLRVTNLILKKIEFSAEVLMKINKTSFLEKYVDKVLEEKIYDNLQQNQILIDSLEFISAMSKITYCKEFCYLIRESQKFFDSKCATLNLAMMKTLVVLAMRPQNLKEMNDFKIIDFIKEKEFNDPEINKKKNILLVFADSPL
ncbi:hypothetical protein TRFO_35881 [Tritrichomonas foetus]|uniref:Uncharacterized protein n=1 Tax=Tritrichomonas foetus TaxID=1144522 RepID=A0A1J4JJW3_9EUKA|nr:hypothetical protein TRFO_35881 [Tritrichomonas foetus]|eukprot:OHS97845.1 hypothetical protein TRFO_35881 [Tritrichomonas foetus]